MNTTTKHLLLSLAATSLLAFSGHPARAGIETPQAPPAPQASGEPGPTGARPAVDGNAEGGETVPVTEPASAQSAVTPEETPEPPTVVWDAKTLELSAEAQAASFTQVREALVAAGIEVKPHPSWEDERITASFQALPLNEAGKALFGGTFVLTWSHIPSEEFPRPRIVLMARPDEPPASDQATADAEESAPDAETLRALAEANAREEFSAAAEAALRSRDHQLREEALALLATREQLMISRELMHQIARTDPSPAVRQQALGLVVNHGFDLRSLSSIVNQGTSSDPVLTSTSQGGDEALQTLREAAESPDQTVSEAGQAAEQLVAQRIRLFESLSPEQRDWLFKPDDADNPLRTVNP